MKNKKILISIVFVIILLTTFVTIGFNHFYKDNNKESKKDFSDSTKISMFFETEINTGNYVEAVASSWPTDGYRFNANMSYCENDSELSWVNNKVVVKAYVKDKCYVYFDKVQTYYWNDGFSKTNYIYPNMPSTTYPTLAQLQSNYAQFSTNPIYIKSTNKHQACLYLESTGKEFCMGANYWDTDAETTKTKLQTAMESSLGTSATSCNLRSGRALCTFGDHECGADSSGLVYCLSGSSLNMCAVQTGGTASC